MDCIGALAPSQVMVTHTGQPYPTTGAPLSAGMMFHITVDQCKGTATTRFIARMYTSLGVFILGNGWHTKQSLPPPVGITVTVGRRMHDNSSRFALNLCHAECTNRTAEGGCSGAVHVGWIETGLNGYDACVGGIRTRNQDIFPTSTTMPHNRSYAHVSEISRVAGILQECIGKRDISDDDAHVIACYMNRAARDSLSGQDEGNFIDVGDCPCMRLYIGDTAITKKVLCCFESERRQALTGNTKNIASKFNIMCPTDEWTDGLSWGPSLEQFEHAQQVLPTTKWSELCVPDTLGTDHTHGRDSIECPSWLW